MQKQTATSSAGIAPASNQPPPAFDAVAAGLVTVDVFVRLPGAAGLRRGEKQEVARLAITGGGPAGNAACVLGALGWRTGFVARLGRDTLSSVARAELARCGVSDALLIDDPRASAPAAVIEIDPENGDRTIFYSLQNHAAAHSVRPPRIQKSDMLAPTVSEAVRGARVLLADGYEPGAALAALALAREHGVPSVLDIEAGAPDVSRELVRLAAHVVLPIATAQNLAGAGAGSPRRILDTLAALTDAQLVITDGARGSWARTPGGGVLHQPAFSVPVLDTTGCGDAWHGAYASALLDGLPLAQRLEFASFVASRVAMELGGCTHLPTRATLAALAPGTLSPALHAALARAATPARPPSLPHTHTT